MQLFKTWFLIGSLLTATVAPLALPAEQVVVLFQLLTEEEHSRKKTVKSETEKFFFEYLTVRFGHISSRGNRVFPNPDDAETQDIPSVNTPPPESAG